MTDRDRRDQGAYKESLELDKRYAEAADFDRKQFESYLVEQSVVFTKRTEYPKLGYLIYRLNMAGIPSIQYGKSFHAPILYVHKDFYKEAWAILGEKLGKSARILDDVDDDSDMFEEYRDTTPDESLWDVDGSEDRDVMERSWRP